MFGNKMKNETVLIYDRGKKVFNMKIIRKGGKVIKVFGN
jgi:hypothetical protein